MSLVRAAERRQVQTEIDLITLSTLDHPSLQTAVDGDMLLTPFGENVGFSSADALSLVGQYAAHLAFLRFAGGGDARFDPGDWCVATRKGDDPTLLRRRPWLLGGADAAPDLTLIEELAQSLPKMRPLAAIEQSWGRGDDVYLEIVRLLGTDLPRARAFRRASIGRQMKTDTDILRAAFNGQGQGALRGDPHMLEVLAGEHSGSVGSRVVRSNRTSASRVIPFSGFPELRAGPGDLPAVIAERLFESEAVVVLLDVAIENLDARSRELVAHLLAAPTRATVLLCEPASSPAETDRLFVVSASTAARTRLGATWSSADSDARRRVISSLRADPAALRRYSECGQLPYPASLLPGDIVEPRKSFVAALALVGHDLPISFAVSYLTTIGSSLPLNEVIDGVATVAGRRVTFNEGVAEPASAHLSAEHRESLITLAVSLLCAEEELALATDLLVRSGRFAEAVRLVPEIDDAAIRSRLLAQIPDEHLEGATPLILERARQLIARGAYLDARRLLTGESDPDARVLLSGTQRRLGRYNEALDTLQGLTSVRAQLLRIELLRLQGELDAAESTAAAVEPLSSGDAEALQFEREMIRIDRGQTGDHPTLSDPHKAARLQTYCSIETDALEIAAAAAARACDTAKSIAERVDAELDVAFVAFLDGHWADARLQCRRVLQLCEETQGDRCAAGALFNLAFFCADEGRFDEASEKIDRLRRFYTRTSDRRRSMELIFLEAYVDFCRGHLPPAVDGARRVLELGTTGDIAEAARLIIDEAMWMSGVDTALVSIGDSACRELRDRHRLLRRWRGEQVTEPELAENRSLFAGETIATERSSRLKGLRFSTGLALRSANVALQQSVRAECAALGVEFEAVALIRDVRPDELVLLQELSRSEFPYADSAFGAPWLLAGRNRLDAWNQWGTLHLDAAELDVLLATEHPDTILLSDVSLLLIERSRNWSPETRAAVASMVRLQWSSFQQRRLLAEPLDEKPAPALIEGVVGESAAVRQLCATLERVARRNVSVTILGESGTGKELMARGVHRLSARRSKPFTAVNCAALPDHLIESELFGHVRGAFTGADRDRVGLVEATDGGTIFLDEVGDLPLVAQAKLLRFLQEGEIRRIGDTVTRRADVRIVSATNRELSECVDDGLFREDLYYRIAQVELRVPPLRDRVGDIQLLADTFLRSERAKQGSGPDRYTDVVESILLSYRWPGNVRELQNTIRAAHALAGDARVIDVEHLPERIARTVIVRRAGSSFHDEVVRFRKGLIERSLDATDGNQNQAAKALGMSRQALSYQIRELGIVVRKGEQ